MEKLVEIVEQISAKLHVDRVYLMIGKKDEQTGPH